MKIFKNYSKYMLSLAIAVLLSSSMLTGCAVDDGTNPSSPNRPTVAAQMPDQADLGQAIAAQNRHSDALMAKDGVIGTGTGVNEHGSPVIYVFTSKPGIANIPTELDHFPTHVEYIGEVKALGKGSGGTKPTPGFRATYRTPMWSGVSVGNSGECAAGTIGCVVTKNNHYYLLSNNHVFARENLASPGESIAQPGRYDNSCNPTGQVASLSEFVPLVFGGPNNTVDAAIAEISGGIIATSQMALGSYTPTATPQAPLVGMAVKKTGRTTGFTQGTISAVNVTVNVGYSGGTARFVGQIYIGGRGVSAGGDSGSLFVESSSNDPVGLLFAGSRTSTIACPIGDVLNAFGVTIVPN